MKNINSFRAIERAIAYETKRQTEVLENGGKIIQETRRWDDVKGQSFAMRSKENAQDYRYFPEPDIPPLYITEDEINHYREVCPEFADEKAERFVEQMNLTEEDAEIITASKKLADLFEGTVKLCRTPSEVRFWFMSQLLYLMNENNIHADKVTLTPEKFAEFIGFINSGIITRQTGREVFEQIFFGDENFDIAAYIKGNNLEQVEDSGLIEATVQEILTANPKAVMQYKNGETKISGFFVGQVMKKLKGKADPSLVNKAVAEALDKA